MTLKKVPSPSVPLAWLCATVTLSACPIPVGAIPPRGATEDVSVETESEAL
jgi:hypothetical protein